MLYNHVYKANIPYQFFSALITFQMNSAWINILNNLKGNALYSADPSIFHVNSYLIRAHIKGWTD